MKHLTDEQIDNLVKSLKEIRIDAIGDFVMVHENNNIEIHYCESFGKIEIQAIQEDGEDYNYTPDQLQRLESELTDIIVYEGKALEVYIDEDYYNEEYKQL